MTMVMIDLETQATRHDARIISIGACAVSNIYTPPSEWPTFLVSIPQEENEGYYVDPDTLKWWSKQGEAAQEALNINSVDSTARALSEFNQWLEAKVGFARENSYNGMINTVWANPPQFDLIILDHAYRLEGIEKPWHYRQERCSRTVWAGRDRSVEPLTPPKNLVKHRADDDALRQMCGLVAIKQREERLNELRDTIADVLNLS